MSDRPCAGYRHAEFGILAGRLEALGQSGLGFSHRPFEDRQGRSADDRSSWGGPTVASRHKHHAGDVIGRYTLVRELAPGFPGPLWLVESAADSGSVPALARIFTFSDRVASTTRENLGSSAWDAMEVEHPNVCRAVDVIFEERHLATIYDYVESQQLNVVGRIGGDRKTPLSTAVALRVIVDVLEASDAMSACARRLQVSGAHGGVLPDSCLVATSGRTHLLDAFVSGCAAAQPELLRVKGRVGYVAPEQFEGKAADERSDVYAIGCVLWELLANRRLHLGGIGTVERNIKRGQLLSLRAFTADDGEEMERLVAGVARATHVDPEKRYPSPIAMRDDLLSLGIEPAEHQAVGAFLEELATDELREQRDSLGSSTVAMLSEVIRSTSLGHSSERPERRSSVPPSSLEEPISIDSHVKFEVPPPYLPPDSPPPIVEQALPMAPRVPRLSVDDVDPEAPPPSSIAPPSGANEAAGPTSDAGTASALDDPTNDGKRQDGDGSAGPAPESVASAEPESGRNQGEPAAPSSPRAAKTGVAFSRERFGRKKASSSSDSDADAEKSSAEAFAPTSSEAPPTEPAPPSVPRPGTRRVVPMMSPPKIAFVTKEDRDSDLGGVVRDRQDTKAGLGSLPPAPNDEGARTTVPGSPAPQANKEGVGLLLTKSVGGSQVPADRVDELIEQAESIPPPPLDEESDAGGDVQKPTQASTPGPSSPSLEVTPKLPAITWFFAGSTLVLLVVVLVLLSRPAPAPVIVAPAASTAPEHRGPVDSEGSPARQRAAQTSRTPAASAAPPAHSPPESESTPPEPLPEPQSEKRSPVPKERAPAPRPRPAASKPKFVPDEL